MNPDSVLREQLLYLLQGGNAHMSFEQAVADFPPDQINTYPPRVTYTPWHILEHLRITQWDILEFIRNPAHVSPPFPKGYWPDPTAQATAEMWAETISAFQADLNALAELIEDSATNLTADLPHAPGYTILREILVVADHNSYHLGELAILRQIMNAWPAKQTAVGVN